MVALLPKKLRLFALSAWFDRSVIVAVILASGVALSLNIADPDLWGHVQYGRDAWEHGLALTTTYSYIAAGYPWINHEILAELALASGYDNLGASGLMLMKVALGMGIIALMIRRARREKVGLLASCPVALLVAVCLANHWTMRPQLISYTSFALMLALLGWCFEGWERSWKLAWPRGNWFAKKTASDTPSSATEREEELPSLVYSVHRLKYLWLVPILMVIWTNSHGGFLAGYCVFVAYLGLRGLEALTNKGREADGLLLRFGMFAVAAGIATFVNPYGLGFHRWLFDDLKVPRPEIVEWRAPNLLEAQNVPFLLLASVWVATLVLSRKQRDLTQIVILGLIFWQSLLHLRHIAFFAIALGFWLPPHLDSVLTRFKVSQEGSSPADALGPLFLRISSAGVFAAWLFCGVQLFFQVKEIKVERGSYPVSAIDYLARQNFTGRMLCTFNWAQYALAALGPNQPGQEGILVHVDGRCRTSYSQSMLDEHFDFVMGQVGPDMRYRGPKNPFNATRALENGNPDLVLISRLQTPSVEVMKGQGGSWVLLYQDQLAQVWGRSSKYGDPKSPNYVPPTRREIGDTKQAGFAKWPAIPARHKPSPHKPEAQAKEIAASR